MEHEAEEDDSNKHVTLDSDESFKKAEPPLAWASCSADSFSSSSSGTGSPTHEINFRKKPSPQPEKNSVLLERKTSSNHVPRVQAVGSGKPPPPDYDPNRIPAFVFSSKPVTPMDWSVASNESMFSIHTGDNSVSKDFPAKSQDLEKLNEVITNLIAAAPAAYTEEETGITKKSSTHASMENTEDRRNEYITARSIEISEDQIKQNTAANSYGFVDEGHKGNLVKADTGLKKQKSQLQFHRAFSNAAGRKWLSCFSCYSPCSCCSGYCRR